MAEALKQPCFAGESAFLDLIIEEAAEFSVGPFVELLRQDLEIDPVNWANRKAALRILHRLAPNNIEPQTEKSITHAFAALRNFADAWTKAPALTSRHSSNGEVELLLIPGGRFMMGSPNGEGSDNEHPAHEVEIRPFYLGCYPVTNEEYARFLTANPKIKQPDYWADRRFNQARQPVVGVDWETARRFATWADGRLPTEAEWEYAARAGSTSRYFWGDSDAIAGDYAWYYGNTGGVTHPVGEKRPNDFGLYDMEGNVWEWTQDRWHENYRGAPSDGSAWEDGESDRRGLRGGSWLIPPQLLRSANRYRLRPDDAYLDLGFRLARDL
jgi:formylglycine-generating enzyme required for sulfatase activity